jgi:hypothetical protein
LAFCADTDAYVKWEAREHDYLSATTTTSVECVPLEDKLLVHLPHLMEDSDVGFANRSKGVRMAEKVVLVCDECGDPAEESVTFKLSSRTLAKDLCRAHVQALVRNAHAPRRGRRSGSAVPLASSPKRTRSASKKKVTTKVQRKRITDPGTLEKRRAALAKARQALAKKRDSAKKAS